MNTTTRTYLLRILLASGYFNDAPQSEPFHAPGVLEPALAVLNSSQEELDVLSFTSVIVALQFTADGITRRQHQQIQ